MRIFILFLAVFVHLTVNANEEWMRYAAISPDGKSIAFTYKGDLYIVPAEGGEGRPLTFHTAHDYEPVWSNDGSKICFASNRFGNFDLFVINARGGEAKRLTYHSNDEIPYTFTSDDKYVLFGAARLDAVNHRQYPTGSQPELYKVAVEGSSVDQFWTIPAEEVQMSNDGKTIIYQDKKGGEDVFRKHHVSAITRDIWKYDVESKKHEILISCK
ncbi:MAG: hypothetical protein PF489_00685 [Salinivirgaceae bacterium]|jgi:tricorn protease|nr:hypothetical protein [Salinivirgaceae bacterium]